LKPLVLGLFLKNQEDKLMSNILIINSQNILLSQDILNILKTFVIKLYREKLDKIILFGSRARADYRPDSDYDILIVLKTDFNYSEEIDKTSEFISDISLTYDIVISRGFTNSFDYVNSKSPFFLNEC
jgi:predicted nucleotidyltransferase